MATGSALILRYVSPPPSISRSAPASPSPSPFLSFSPHSLSKRTARSSLMVSASRGPVSPVDLSDPLVSSLSSSDSFEFWPQRDPNVLPYLDVVASSSFKPRLSAQSVEAVTSPTQNDYSEKALSRLRDTDSKLLAARVVSVTLPPIELTLHSVKKRPMGIPTSINTKTLPNSWSTTIYLYKPFSDMIYSLEFVPFVSELVITQLLFLQGVNPNEPIYMYIDSLGTSNDEESVALEAEAFAIYDVMMTLKNEIHTVALETVGGHACLLLAAGTEGKRYMMPNAQVLLPEPEVPYYGDMPTSDLVRRTREALIQEKVLVELIAKHTGNSFEEVHALMRTELPLSFEEAEEFGIVDQMVVRGETKLMADLPSSKKQAMRRMKAPAQDVNF